MDGNLRVEERFDSQKDHSVMQFSQSKRDKNWGTKIKAGRSGLHTKTMHQLGDGFKRNMGEFMDDPSVLKTYCYFEVEEIRS